jgi:GxxExxY protein
MHAEHADERRLNALSANVIGCAFNVLNMLGAGFSKKVYDTAVVVELRERGMSAVQQSGITALYHGVAMGAYFTDLLVDKQHPVELKVAKARDDTHCPQCINYLKRTGLYLCPPLNLARPKLEIKRFVRAL